MSEILTWLSEYSPFVVLLLALGAGFLYVIKLIVERAISTQARELELRLERRSAFEEKILNDRFATIVDLVERLQRIMTDLNRTRHGKEVEGLYEGNEVVPLTRIYEDLNIHRLLLGDTFHTLLTEKANLALNAANVKASDEHWNQIAGRWMALDARLREAIDQQFPISTASW